MHTCKYLNGLCIAFKGGVEFQKTKILILISKYSWNYFPCLAPILFGLYARSIRPQTLDLLFKNNPLSLLAEDGFDKYNPRFSSCAASNERCINDSFRQGDIF